MPALSENAVSKIKRQSLFCYNMEVEVSDKLESKYKGLYIIGDGSGITHSLSHASASGVHVARNIAESRK